MSDTAGHHDPNRLTENERQRLLRVLREIVPSIPLRPHGDVEDEVAEIRAARRGGGRRHPVS